MEIYSTSKMLQVIEGLRVPGQFLLNSFFNNVVQFNTEQITFDTQIDDLTIAPFVSPVVAGKVQKAQGYETKTLKPAYVKPKTAIDPSQVIVRQAGEGLGGTISPADRERLILGQELTRHVNQINRRLEVMASEILRTGQLTIEGDQYQKVVLDYGRHADLTKILSGAEEWGDTGVSPVDGVEAMADRIGELTGAAADFTVFGKNAWSLFKADPQLDKILDRTRGQDAVVKLGYEPGVPGAPVYKGTIGTTDLFVYNDTYKEGSTVKTLIDPYDVIIGAPKAGVGTRAFGAIADAEAGFQALEMFPKSWVEKDPSIRYLMTQSAPILYMGRPNAVARIKVKSA